MTKEWYQLRDWIDTKLMEYNISNMEQVLHYGIYSSIKKEMNKIESQRACESLKEAGY